DRPARSVLFPSTTRFRSRPRVRGEARLVRTLRLRVRRGGGAGEGENTVSDRILPSRYVVVLHYTVSDDLRDSLPQRFAPRYGRGDRKSTRLNSSHVQNSH